MKWKKIAALFLPEEEREILGRFKFRDAAGPVFKFRMGAGSPGDVNRSHPVTIESCLIDASAPPTAYGQPVVVDATTQGVRPLVAGDSGLSDIYGITVRPFPLQQNTATPTFGSGTPPTSGVIDVLRSGYIMVQLNVTGAAKGGQVFIWVAATSGSHIQDQFEIATGGGSNTISLPIPATSFNGTEDASKVVEVGFHI
jgi:hypothetical protein